MTQGVGNWTFNVLPGQAGRRSEKQSPWYDMATAAVAMIARPYIPQGGKVYDSGMRCRERRTRAGADAA